MHRRGAFPVASAVLLVAVLGVPSSLIAAQSATDGSGVTYELLVGGETRPGTGSELRLYAVVFEPGAGIPLNEYPEAMVVSVEEGSLALVTGPDLPAGAIVVVAPDGGSIRIDKAGTCPSPCAARPDQTLLLEPGSAVFHAAGGHYSYQSRRLSSCLLNSVIAAVGADLSWGRLGRAEAVTRSSAVEVEETIPEANAKRGLINICGRKV